MPPLTLALSSYIRGVAYQGAGDPLADATACKRDVPILRELRTNVIRTYSIDPTADHTECMRLLAEAGIYVVSDLANPSYSINRIAPSWETDVYNHYTAVIDALAPYNNTLGFFAGNEVANSAGTTNAAPFVKAAVRDMKSYIKQKGYRPMGVGYANNDDANTRVNMANYFNCGGPDESVDFWGYNIYEWCGHSTYAESGYQARTAEFQNYSVPVFFAEYGCNAVQPRTFGQIPTIFSKPMDEVWSGAIVYMYFQETNNYGESKARQVKWAGWRQLPMSFACLITKRRACFGRRQHQRQSNARLHVLF